MSNILTREENAYLKNCLQIIWNDKESVLKEIEERKKNVQSILNCLDEHDTFLLDSYGEEKIMLDNIEKKIAPSLKVSNVKIEIMKNALDMYIRDTAEKIVFIHDNLGNDSGMMEHFRKMLDTAKEMKNEIIKG